MYSSTAVTGTLIRLSVLIIVATNIQTASCMRLNTAPAGIVTTASHGRNGTATASSTRPSVLVGTGTRPASQTTARSRTGIDFTSGPCPTDVARYPSFIRPSINPTQSCDIFGPLCQTGSIAVGVNVSSGVPTTTTVPCSCYLTAQSLTASHGFDSPYDTAYGRSPQCTAFAGFLDSPKSAIDASIFSKCPGGQFPGAPGFHSLDGAIPSMPEINGNGSSRCCGACRFQVPEIKLSFFPPPGNATCGNKITPAKPSITRGPDSTSLKRALYPRDKHGSIAVSNGFTYTSPSIYVEISQPLSLVDECGNVGKSFSSTILAFAPGVISTVSYDIPLGANLASYRAEHGPFVSVTKTLDPKDLACPTWGLSGPWNPNFSAAPLLDAGGWVPQVNAGGGLISEVDAGTHATVGAPFFPIVVMPTEALSLDPAWASCRNNFFGVVPVFDPPRTLDAQAVLAAPGAPPPTPTPTLELVAPTAVSSPAPVGQPLREQALATSSPSPGSNDVGNGNADPADPSNGGPPAPAAVSPVSSAAVAAVHDPGNPVVQEVPLSSTTAEAAVAPAPSNPVQTAVVGNPGSPTTNAPSPPPNVPDMAQLQSALAVSTSQAAVPVPVPANSPPANNQPANNQPANNQPANNQPANNQPAKSPPANSPPSNNQPAKNPPTNSPPTNNHPANGPVANNQPAEAPNASTQAANSPVQPANNSPQPVNGSPPPANSPPQAANGPPAPAPAFAAVMDSSASSPGTPPAPAAPKPGLGSIIMGQFTPPTTPQAAGGPVSVPSESPGAAQAPEHAAPPPGPTDAPNESGPEAASPGQNVPPQANSNPSNDNLSQVSSNGVTPPSTSLNPGPLPNAPNAVSPSPSLPSDSHIQGSSNANSPQEPPLQSAVGPPAPILSFAGSNYQVNPSSAFIIASHTLTPGAQITVSTYDISLASDGAQAIIGSSTQQLQPSEAPLGYQTLPLSGPPLPASSTPLATQPALTIGGAAYTSDSAAAYVITSQTLRTGKQVTVGSTPISLASDGGYAVIAGTETQNIVPEATPSSASIPSTLQSAFNVAGKPYVVATGSSAQSDGITLSVVGATVTVSSTPVVLEPSGVLKVGSTEVPIGTGGATGIGSASGGGNGSVVIQPGLGGNGGERSKVPVTLLMATLGAVLLYKIIY